MPKHLINLDVEDIVEDEVKSKLALKVSHSERGIVLQLLWKDKEVSKCVIDTDLVDKTKENDYEEEDNQRQAKTETSQ